MKKIVLSAIAICFAAIAVASIAMIFCEENCTLAVNSISKIVMQSTLTGVITFLGLLFTLSSQEQRYRTENEVVNCPSIVVCPQSSPPSGEIKTNRIVANLPIIYCTSETTKRTVDCTCINCRNNYALNVYVVQNDTKQFISLHNNKKELTLVLSSKKEDSFEIFFENIYGIRYRQKIDYNFQDGYKEVIFISSPPERT